MRNKWIRKAISLGVILLITTILSPASPALAAPVTTISASGTPGDNGWFISDVTVTLTATDNVSGVEGIEYSFDYWQTSYTYSSPFVISNEGYYSLWARAWDNQGHMGASTVRYINIDKTMPHSWIWKSGGTPGNNGWWVSDVTVVLLDADNVSTVSQDPIQYSVNGGGWLDWDGLVLIISNDGITTILTQVHNMAGIQESPPASGEVKLDKTKPVTTISFNGTAGNENWYRSNVTVTLTATDSTSGVATTEYSLNGGSSWQTYSVPLTFSSEGTTTLLARTRDNAGNLESPPASRDIKIDKTNPVVTETVNPTQISSKGNNTMFDISYNGTAADQLSGVYTVNTTLIDEYGDYSQNLGSNLSGTVSVERHSNGNDQNGRTYTFRLTVTDTAGNQATIDAVTTVSH